LSASNSSSTFFQHSAELPKPCTNTTRFLFAGSELVECISNGITHLPGRPTGTFYWLMNYPSSSTAAQESPSERHDGVPHLKSEGAIPPLQEGHLLFMRPDQIG